MKHGSGMKDRDDRSSGIEILMSDDFAKIKPADPLRVYKDYLDKQCEEIGVDPIPQVVHYREKMIHGEYAKTPNVRSRHISVLKCPLLLSGRKKTGT